jgi:hypothetical protein
VDVPVEAADGLAIVVHSYRDQFKD